MSSNNSTKKIPRLVLVGPTNVGKSALFNRLTKTRSAIVCDRPGVTVDRHELKVDDTPIGEMSIVDTGGVGPLALAHPLGAEIERAANVAVDTADLIFFVVDGTRDVGIEEFEVASWLRKHPSVDQKSVWVIVNKTDSKRHNPHSYFALGFDRLLSVSAEHDEGILELWEAVESFFKTESLAYREEYRLQTEEENDEFAEPKTIVESVRDPRIVVLGRPNVGKSTLLNSLLGNNRHVVSEVAGTTREPIESEFSRNGMTWLLADTAGIRQPGRLERDVEWVAREKLKDLAKKADVAVVVFDAHEGISDLDASIVGMALDFGLSVVVALNKWDKMSGTDAEDRWNALQRSTDLKLEFIKFCPTVKISGLTGKGMGELTKTIQKIIEARKFRVQTSKLNQIFEQRLRLHAHPMGPYGRPAKFYYLSQVAANPPEFVMFANLPGKAVHFSYRRFIVNAIRSEFGFAGTPIKVHFKVATSNNHHYQ